MSSFDATIETVSFCEDIQQMMYSFGDCENASKSSALLIEDIIFRFIGQLIFKLAEITEKRGSKTMNVEDILFHFKNNQPRLTRCLQFVELKRFQKSSPNIIENDAEDQTPFFDDNLTNIDSKKLKDSMHFISSINPFGPLNTNIISSSFNSQLLDRKKRLELRTREMSASKYISFSNARKFCFASPNGIRDKLKKFKSWISPHLLKIDQIIIANLAMEMLAFLAYEAVGELIDLVLIMRSTDDQSAGPISTNEIREVIRRLSMPNKHRTKIYPLLIQL